jgi:PIN domain nuclease of toxin-antitoxin system
VILLDPHVAVWIALDQDFGKQSRQLARRALVDDALAISAFSFWELAMLIAKQS